jgi:hypothetical protein
MIGARIANREMASGSWLLMSFDEGKKAVIQPDK